jgi:hypothetical protein
MHIGSGQDQDYIDKLHVQIYMIIKRQSERDFPRGSIRNGIIDGTKCQAEERKGNLFLLLVMAHTVEGSTKLQKGLGYYSNARWKSSWNSSSCIYLWKSGFVIATEKRK